MKKLIAILAILIILALVAAAGSYYYMQVAVSPESAAGYNSSNNTPTAVLQTTNPDFQTGYAAMVNGDYTTANQYFEKALAEVTDSTQEAQIEYDMAIATERSGDFTSAIQQLKNIAANNPDWTIMEAYAVQELAEMHYNNLSNTSITQAIFSTAPYSSFVTSTSTVGSEYHQVYGYAASLYPLGVPESNLAIEGTDMLLAGGAGAAQTPQGVALVAQINQEIAAAAADVTRTENDPVASSYIPEILVNEGIAYSNLAQAGAGDPSAGEQTFIDAMRYEAADGDKPGDLVRFYYASFLDKVYGTKRQSDIVSILTPFTVGNSANIYSDASNYLAGIATSPSETRARGEAVALAAIDPSFKQYLISIGWQASDFSSS